MLENQCVDEARLRSGFDSRRCRRVGAASIRWNVGELAGQPPVARGVSDESFEDRGEVRLRLEANRQGDLHDRHSAISQECFGAPDSPPQEEFVGTQAGRRTELRCKMHPA
jgi:hypothetical protein